MKNLILLTLAFFAFSASAFAGNKESTYDRVMRTNTIRCGYATAYPWIYHDEKDGGKLKGFVYDMTEELGKRLSLKIDWAEEINWDALPTAVHSGRVDMACSLLWSNAARGRMVAFTRPMFYSAVYAYGRVDDSRFTGKVEDIDKPDVGIATLDGDISQVIANITFPHATQKSQPPMTPNGVMLLSVVDKKVDVAMVNTGDFNAYNKENQNKLHRITDKPVRIYGTGYAVGITEPAFQNMIDAAVEDMVNSGYVAQVLKEQQKLDPGAYLMLNDPYRMDDVVVPPR